MVGRARVVRPREAEPEPARRGVRTSADGVGGTAATARWLQRTAGNRATTTLLRGDVDAAAPGLQRQDMHGDAAEPDPDEQRATLSTIAPGTFSSTPSPPPPSPGPGPAPAPAPPTPARWTGYPAAGQPMRRAQWVARRDLKRDLRAELIRQLDAEVSRINALKEAYDRRRMPMTSFEGPGEVAKTVVDDEVGSYVDAAAATPSQSAARHAHRFTASGRNRNLLDAYDRRDRARAGSRVNAEAVLWWMVDQENAPAIKEAQNFTPSDWNYEERWLYHQVINPIARRRKRDLENYDRFGFALAPGGGRVLIGGMATAGDTTRAATPDEVRMELWAGWETLVHEYIHTLEHSAHEEARRASAADTVLNEGMTEHFTHRILNAAIPRVRGDEALRRRVEGIAAGDPVPPLTTAILHATYPVNSTYAPHVTRVRAIPGLSEEAKRASFFQGHVEYLGLTTAGQPATPVAAGTSGAITVPSGVGSLADLAALTGVDEAAIRTANPSITDWSTLAPRVHVPGWRDHVVVEASDGRATTAETPSQIATQHGTTEAEVERVNRPRFAAWPSLSAGDRLLVPSGSGSP